MTFPSIPAPSRIRLIILCLTATAALRADLEHLVLTEIVLQPSDGEYVVIHNPTGAPVDLSDYYITDATDTTAGEFYYNLPADSVYWSEVSSDFIARFPAGSVLGAGESVTLSVRDSSRFASSYGFPADLTLVGEMRDAVEGVSTRGSASAPKLHNDAETLILFTWDGVSSTVKDVDYVLWGSSAHAVDKSSVTGYLPDTPVSLQRFMTPHVNGEKLVRMSQEGSESTSGGNGITGHDETSEPLDETWTIVSLTSTKPEIVSVAFAPESPSTEDLLFVSAVVTDDDAVAAVELVYVWQSDTLKVAMNRAVGDTFAVTLDPLGEAGLFSYYVRASDFGGLKDSTSVFAVQITAPPPTLSIADLLDSLDTYTGQEVTVTGVITVPAGKLRTTFTEAFLQDTSGRGIILYQAGLDTSLHRGDSVRVTATVEVFQDKPELTNYSATFLKSGAAIPAVELSIAEFNTLNYLYTYVKLWGKITSRSNPSGTNAGANIDIQDETGEVTTVRIWNTTGVLYNERFELVNPALDSLLVIGRIIEVSGIGGSYGGVSQIQPAYADEIAEKLEGTLGDYTASLEVEPYPFVPQWGEVIGYRYSFPADARVRVEVFDLSGKLVTTLYDEFRSLSFYKESVWNGRNELNELVSPGIYVMHLEVVDRSTGRSWRDAGPVVVGTAN